MTTVLPSRSTSRPPYDQNSGYSQPWLSPKPCPSSKPNGCPFFLSRRPAASRSSQVSGNFFTPTSANQSVRYASSWPMLPHGSAFHLLFTTTASSTLSCQGPSFLPISVATSVRSTSPASKRWGQLIAVIATSGPDFVSTMVVSRVSMPPTLTAS